MMTMPVKAMMATFANAPPGLIPGLDPCGVGVEDAMLRAANRVIVWLVPAMFFVVM